MFVQGVKELLMSPGKLPGCSGARNLHDNISDLRAQVAANQKVSAPRLPIQVVLTFVIFCRVFHLLQN